MASSSLSSRVRRALEGGGAQVDQHECRAVNRVSQHGCRGSRSWSGGTGENNRGEDGGRGRGGREGGFLHTNLVFLVVVALTLLTAISTPATGMSFEDHDWVHGRRSSFVPLSFRATYDSIRGPNHIDSIHRRRLKGIAQMPLYGGVLLGGYFYAYVFLGTPPKRFALIVDTGSTVLYVPCSTCLKCGTHQDSAFAPKASSTYRKIPCSGSCDQCSDDPHPQCMYQRHYAEDSTSKGLLANDVIGFGDRSSIQGARINFGCELFESGDIYLQRADGIIGLGRGPLSVVDQLVKQEAMGDAFSICYGGMGEAGGALLLGSSVPPPDMQFTPLDLHKSYYYCVILEGVRLDGEILDVPPNTYTEGYGAVLDSGTTFAYLPSQAFHVFKKKVEANIDLQRVEGPDPNFQDICFSGASTDISKLADDFPTVEFVFQGNVSISLAPENYLFMHKKIKGAYCFGFFKNPDRGTLIGGIAVRNMLVTYDRENMRVGFAPRKCSTLLSEIPAVIPSTTDASSEPSPANPSSDSSPGPEPELPPESIIPPDSGSAAEPSYQVPSWLSPPSTPLVVSPPKRPPQESRPLVDISQSVPSDRVDNGSHEAPSANVSSAPREVCPGCALKIFVNITLLDAVKFDAELQAGFKDDMARELGLQLPQVEVLKYVEDIQCVACVILPEPAAQYLPANVTTGIVNRLQNKTAVHFRDALGDYNVTSISVLPVSAESLKAESFWKRTSTGGVAAIVIASVAGVAIFGALIGFFIWRLKRYSSYRTVSEIQFEEDERVPRF